MTKTPNNPAIAPVDGLVDLACRDGVDVRPTLLRVLTDLYVQKPAHSDEETTQYVELALGLIDAVDAGTRAAVAARLSAYAAAPEAVVAKLAAADAPEPLLAVPVVPAALDADADLIDLFFSADSEERRIILLNLDVVPGASPGVAGAASAEHVRHLENAALTRNAGEFVRVLERALGIHRDVAERIARDPAGEPIVVTARALGMKAAVLQRILLFLNPAVGQSVQRVFDLADLYDELPISAANRMVEIWRERGQPAATVPVHAPVYQDDTRSAVRGSSASDTRPTADRIDWPSPFQSAG